jgi:hypothetical protein
VEEVHLVENICCIPAVNSDRVFKKGEEEILLRDFALQFI